MSRTIHTHDWWIPYLNECKKSNMKCSEYCRKNGLNYDAFLWHWRLESKKYQSRNGNQKDILPIVVSRPEQLDIMVNGIKISGSKDTVQRLLGIIE